MAHYFGTRLLAGAEKGIVFGNEGQEWRLVNPLWFSADPQTLSYFRKIGVMAVDAF